MQLRLGAGLASRQGPGRAEAVLVHVLHLLTIVTFGSGVAIENVEEGEADTGHAKETTSGIEVEFAPMTAVGSFATSCRSESAPG